MNELNISDIPPFVVKSIRRLIREHLLPEEVRAAMHGMSEDAIVLHIASRARDVMVRQHAWRQLPGCNLIH